MIFTIKMHCKGIEKIFYKNAFEIIIYHKNALETIFTIELHHKNAMEMIFIIKML